MTYFFVLVGTWITSFLCPRKLKINGKNREGEIIYIVFWAIILVSLCGLRRYDVGRDTSMYYYTYGVMQKRTSLREVFGSYNYFEYGFYLTEYLISRVFSYQVHRRCIRQDSDFSGKRHYHASYRYIGRRC